MKLRNNIFAAAFDYLKRNTDIKTQKELARRMGVNENTITRILRDYTEVTEDIITKLQTASGCIFNLQWLRGEDPIHMLVEDLNDGMVAHFLTPEGEERNAPIDHSSLVNAALAAKDETISVLREQLSTKDELIAVLRQQIELLKQQVTKEQAEDYLKDFPFTPGVAENRDKKDHVRV